MDFKILIGFEVPNGFSSCNLSDFLLTYPSQVFRLRFFNIKSQKLNSWQIGINSRFSLLFGHSFPNVCPLFLHAFHFSVSVRSTLHYACGNSCRVK